MRKKDGFTLVEIIVTVVILAVLMAVAVPVSLNYMDDIQEQKVLSEAESVFTQAQSSHNRLSLSGNATDNDSEISITDNEWKKNVVSKSQGNGEIIKITFKNDKIIYMSYKIGNLMAIYEESVGHFVIGTAAVYGNGADAIMNDLTTILVKDKNGNESYKTMKQIMLDFIGGKNYAIGTKINSEAGNSSGLAGAGYNINQLLNIVGYDTENISWQIEVLEPQTSGDKKGVRRYQFLFTDFKITQNDVNKSISAMKYIYYEDGSKDEGMYNEEKNYGASVKCTVVMQTDAIPHYPVLKK